MLKQQVERDMYEMECEVATMELVRSRTNIPIPKVFAANFNDYSAVGFPYVLMEYVSGSTAAELAATFPGKHEGIPEPFTDKFMRQMASVMLELACIRMPKIGSVNKTPNGYGVGKLVDTFSGPYDNALDFYEDYPSQLASVVYGENWRECDHVMQLVQAFERLPKPRVSTELLIMEFNMLAVIDWDTVFAVPDAALYRVPMLMGIAPAVPGLVETHPACKAREKLFLRFAEIVERRSNEMVQSLGSSKIAFTRDDFCSKEAIAFRALVHLQQNQDWVNEEWSKGLTWLAEKSSQEVLDFYLADI